MTTVDRIYLKPQEFQNIIKVLQGRKIYYIAGTHTAYVPSRKEKYILSHRPDGTKLIRDWPNLDGKLETMTPSEAARTELKRTFPGLKRVGWMASTVNLFDWRWPMYYSGPHEGHGVYIDLKGAYHQLYSRLWLDVAFPCGYGSLWLGWIADALKEWKAARNSLIGIIAAREITGVLGYRSFPLTTHNPYLSPHLWATIQGILNEIAFLAFSYGAIYIATDGYIFPDYLDAQHFEEHLYDWGLQYRKVSGNYDIKQWGGYRIQNKRTKPYREDSLPQRGEFYSINLPDSDHPTRLINWWSKSIPHYSNSRWNGGIKEWQRTV